MSGTPEIDGIVALRSLPGTIEAVPEPLNGHPASIEAETPPPAPAPETAVRARRQRPRWLFSAAIAVVGLIVSGTLGYFLYATTNQRDALHRQLTTTQTTLASTNQQLDAARADAASKKVTADYAKLYISDSGKVQTDFANSIICNSYSECRTAAQSLLTDLQAFQADRAKANVPTAATSSDNELGDALSAAIAGVQEAINGMDTDSMSKVDAGWAKVNSAMLNVAKAEAALGVAL